MLDLAISPALMMQFSVVSIHIRSLKNISHRVIFRKNFISKIKMDNCQLEGRHSIGQWAETTGIWAISSLSSLKIVRAVMIVTLAKQWFQGNSLESPQVYKDLSVLRMSTLRSLTFNKNSKIGLYTYLERSKANKVQLHIIILNKSKSSNKKAKLNQK